MNKALEYGDIVTVNTTNGYWTAGAKFFIIAPEGDGELGLREHALCFKCTPDMKPNKSQGAYEIPWTEIDFETVDDAAIIGLRTKIENLDKEISTKSVQKRDAEKLYKAVKEDKDVFLHSFAEEVS